MPDENRLNTYSPNFVYRYREVRDLTQAEPVALGRTNLEAARNLPFSLCGVAARWPRRIGCRRVSRRLRQQERLPETKTKANPAVAPPCLPSRPGRRCTVAEALKGLQSACRVVCADLQVRRASCESVGSADLQAFRAARVVANGAVRDVEVALASAAAPTPSSSTPSSTRSRSRTDRAGTAGRVRTNRPRSRLAAGAAPLRLLRRAFDRGTAGARAQQARSPCAATPRHGSGRRSTPSDARGGSRRRRTHTAPSSPRSRPR